MDEEIRSEHIEPKEDGLKECFRPEKRRIEEAEKTTERLDELGIKAERMERLDSRFLKEMPEHIEGIYKKYPDLAGYVTSVKAEKLPEGVLARTGPYLNEKGEYAGAQIGFSERLFGKKNYELKIIDYESDCNWKGERWLAGRGAQGVITHEMAHAMALKINSEDAGLELGQKDNERFEDLKNRYHRNSKIVGLCNNSLKDLGISPRDIGSEISTYASSDFGEMFAESMSQYETRKHPSRLSTEIHDRYLKLVEERNNQAEEREAV